MVDDFKPLLPFGIIHRRLVCEQGVVAAFVAFQKLANRQQELLGHGKGWHLSESNRLVDGPWKPLLEHVKKWA